MVALWAGHAEISWQGSPDARTASARITSGFAAKS